MTVQKTSFTDWIRSVVVDSPTSYEAAAKALLTVKHYIDTTKEHQKLMWAPIKPQLDILLENETILKEKMSAYVDLALPQASANATAALVAGDKAGIMKALSPVPAVDGIRTSNRVEVEVVDEAQVPDEYFVRVLDKRKLEADVRAGKAVTGTKRTDRTQISVVGVGRSGGGHAHG